MNIGVLVIKHYGGTKSDQESLGVLKPVVPIRRTLSTTSKAAPAEPSHLPNGELYHGEYL